MSSKKTDLKEKFRLALSSTAKVISDDLELDKESSKYKNLKEIEINSLTNLGDFIRLRAETDSSALKKKFSNEVIYRKNLPNNTSSVLKYSKWRSLKDPYKTELFSLKNFILRSGILSASNITIGNLS